MKKFEIFSNVAFYDCVANNDILTSVAQSIKWSDEARKKGVDMLYISSKDDTAFKVCNGSAIVPIKKDLYASEYAKCVTAKEAKQVEIASTNAELSGVTIPEISVKDNPITMISDTDFREKVRAIIIDVLQEVTISLLK